MSLPTRPPKIPPARRPLVTACYAVSWDGRVLDQRLPAKPVDAVLFGSETDDPGAPAGAARVLVSRSARITANFFQAASSPAIVYSTARLPKSAQAALAANPQARAHLRPGGEWPLRAVLEHLRATHGARRVAFAGGPEMFRELVTAGLLDELCLAWRPCIGPKSASPLTGLAGDFLPRGIALDLLKLERAGDECLAWYKFEIRNQKFERFGGRIARNCVDSSN